jgi:CBS domain containing-hemolysin-like protein
VNEWVLVAIGLALTLGTGLFVAAEFALVNLNRSDLERRAARGERRLGPTISALRITSTHLSSAQLGITLTTLLTGYTLEPAISRLLRDPLTALGLPQGAVPGVGAVVGITVATLFSMIIGELVPKNFALAVPVATAKLVVPFQRGFTAVFKPMVLLLNNTANGIIRRLGVEPKEELSGARSADELTYLIRHSAMAGLLEEHDAHLLDRTLRFSDLAADDVMTPRVQMETVQVRDTARRVIEVSSASGSSRLLVVDDGPDDVVGLVHVKHAFAVPLEERTRVRARDLMVEPVRVPETLSAEEVLARLRSTGTQLAVVSDEYGGTAGLVTLEDLVEELVGELYDEHDRALARVTRRDDGVSFDASWRPDELRDRLGIVVPESDDWETVAGFVTAELGRVGAVDAEVQVPGGRLVVERMDGLRIARLRYRGTPGADEQSASAPPAAESGDTP